MQWPHLPLASFSFHSTGMKYFLLGWSQITYYNISEVQPDFLPLRDALIPGSFDIVLINFLPLCENTSKEKGFIFSHSLRGFNSWFPGLLSLTLSRSSISWKKKWMVEEVCSPHNIQETERKRGGARIPMSPSKARSQWTNVYPPGPTS
jgi:hypothetical protein